MITLLFPMHISKGNIFLSVNALYICLVVFVYKPVFCLWAFKKCVRKNPLLVLSHPMCLKCLCLQPSLSVFISDTKHATTSNENHKASPILFFSCSKVAVYFLALWTSLLVLLLNLITSVLFFFIPVRLVWSFVTKGFLCALEYICRKWGTVEREYDFMCSPNIVCCITIRSRMRLIWMIPNKHH